MNENAFTVLADTIDVSQASPAPTAQYQQTRTDRNSHLGNEFVYYCKKLISAVEQFLYSNGCLTFHV